MPTMLTILNLSLGKEGAKQVIQAEADVIRSVLLRKAAGSSVEYDLGPRALLERTSLDVKVKPSCVSFLVLRNLTFSTSDICLGQLTRYFFHRLRWVNAVIFLKLT